MSPAAASAGCAWLDGNHCAPSSATLLSRRTATDQRSGPHTNAGKLIVSPNVKTPGAGSFGAVNIAIDRKTSVRRAVKTMVKRFGPGGALEANFVRRVQHEACQIGQYYEACGAALHVL